MRDYVVVALVLASLPIGLVQPFYGALVYAWISYMYPHLLAWSFAQDFPVAKLSALSVLIGSVLRPSGDAAIILLRRENVWMILLFLAFTLSSVFAIYPDRAWNMWFDVTKIIVMALVTSILLTERKKIRYFLIVVAFSLGFYGFKGGIFSFLTGGQQMVWGPGHSIIGANNAIGLALNMCLPVLWYLAKDTPRKWAKLLLMATFFLTIHSIMFTYSRASALGLAVVLFCIILKGRYRVIILGLALFGGSFALGFLPEKWLDRQQSTLEYVEDRSASSRLDEWYFCWQVARDKPLFGGGFALYSTETYFRYYPEFLSRFPDKVWSAHSIYFGTLAEHGLFGIVAFSGMILSSLLTLARVKRMARRQESLKELGHYSDMLQISILGFMVNGAFVDMAYFELIYQSVGLVASLSYVAHKEMAMIREIGQETQMEGSFSRESLGPLPTRISLPWCPHRQSVQPR